MQNLRHIPSQIRLLVGRKAGQNNPAQRRSRNERQTDKHNPEKNQDLPADTHAPLLPSDRAAWGTLF
jgi:hypothetical protein